MSTQPLRAPSDDIAAQAADWIVQLTGDDEAQSTQARQAFEQWKAQDARHAQAAARLQSVLDRLDAVRATSPGHTRPARRAIHGAMAGYKTSQRIKKTSAVIAIALLCAMPVWMMSQTHTAHYWMADMRTSIGQRETHTLVDGTSITLGSKTAVNIRFDKTNRLVDLVSGAVLVDVAKDTLRPFTVSTSEGTIRALGTRFVVERNHDVTTLTMLESSVAVQTADQIKQGSQAVRLIAAGEQIRMTGNTISAVTAIDRREVSDTWQFGQLVVRNEPLTDVLDALNQHRPGFIRYDRAQLAGMMMSVVLPIDNTDQALQLIANSLPDLRVRMVTPYFVYVDRPQVR